MLQCWLAPGSVWACAVQSTRAVCSQPMLQQSHGVHNRRALPEAPRIHSELDLVF